MGRVGGSITLVCLGLRGFQGHRTFITKTGTVLSKLGFESRNKTTDIGPNLRMTDRLQIDRACLWRRENCKYWKPTFSEVKSEFTSGQRGSRHNT